MNNEGTFYQAMRRQGVARHSFLKYYSLTATSLGLSTGMAPKITWVLKNRLYIPVMRIHSPECACCTEFFIRSAHPLTEGVILPLISPDCDDTLIAAAGTQAEEVSEDITVQYSGKYILAAEGNPSLGGQKMFCISSGRSFIEKLKRAVAGANTIVAWGTCVPRGYVQAARSNLTQATPIDKVITDKPAIKVPDCPPVPDAVSAIITYVMASDRLPDADRMGHPLMLYGQYIHSKCYHRAHFDAGEFAQSWGDGAARKGCCLYKMDCKRSTTCNACSSTRWNDGVPLPIQSGHGYLGCAENGFWDRDSFYNHVIDILQMGTHPTANAVGLTAFDVVTVAVGVHAAASTVDQRKHYNQQPTEAEHQPGNEDKQA